MLPPDSQVKVIKPQLDSRLKEGDPILNEYKTLSEYGFQASEKVDMTDCMQRIRIRKSEEGKCQAFLTELEFIRGGDIWLDPQERIERYIPQLQLDNNGDIESISIRVQLKGEELRDLEEPIGLDKFVDLDKVSERRKDKEEMIRLRKLESENRMALAEKRRIENEKWSAEQEKKFAEEQRQKAQEEQERKRWEAQNPFLALKNQSVKAVDVSYTFKQNEYKANQSLKGRRLKVYGRVAKIKMSFGVPEVYLEGHEYLHYVVFKLSSRERLDQISVGREVILEGVCTGMGEVIKLEVEFEDGGILFFR